MDWIDIPVLKAMEYFSGVMAWFLHFGTICASVIGLCGIVWAGFRILNSRLGIKQGLFDILFKWLLFVIMINMYVPFTKAVGYLGNKIGTEAGNGKQTIVQSLKDIKKSIEEDVTNQSQAAMSLQMAIAPKIKSLNIDMDFSHYDSYNSYVEALQTALDDHSLTPNWNQRDNIQEILDAAKYDPLYWSASDRATLNAIKSVLVEKKLDGTDGDSLVDSYIDLDLFLNDSEGNDTSYFSPSSLCRLVMLTAQIMRAKLEQEWAIADANWEEQAHKDHWDSTVAVMKIGYDFNMFVERLVPSILCFLSQLMLIFTSMFCAINYVMIVFEYIVVIGIGSFFLPFILFDGTKDMAKKLIPVFTGFFIKFIVIDIIMFFIYWLYIDQCVTTLADSGSIGNLTTFATVAFNAIVALVLTRQAPKIADTLLTGRPSLDFGEFRQTMHDARAAAHTIKSGATTAARGTINGGINAAGHLNKAFHAGSTASSIVKAGNPAEGRPGGGWFAQKAAFLGAAGSSLFSDAGEAVKGGAENFLHGGFGGTGSGGGGSSSSAYMRSGQYKGMDAEGNKIGNTINNQSNAKFQNASVYDANTDSNRNATLKEWMGERGSQGDNAGIAFMKKFGVQDHRFDKKEDGTNEDADKAAKEASGNNTATDPAKSTEDAGSIGGQRQSGLNPDSGNQDSGGQSQQPKQTPPDNSNP